MQANFNGQATENEVAHILRDLNVNYETQHKYTSIYKTTVKMDFLVKYKTGTIGIEVKSQKVGGSVDEKLPYVFHNAKDYYKTTYSVIVLKGNGFRNGAIEWLKEQASTMSNLYVCDISELKPILQMMTQTLYPVCKWVGGKGKMKEYILKYINMVEFDRYIEPFAGGLAILLALKPKNALISDTNAHLIALYQAIKTDPTTLINEVKMIENDNETYEQIKKEFNISHKPSHFLYLNRTCFRGIYRENKSGQFNVPYGNYQTVEYDEENIRNVSNYFNVCNVTFTHCDYKTTILDCRDGDVIYMDPPYYPTSKTSFVSYGSAVFGIPQQHELREIFGQLSERNLPVILSNSCCQPILELYGGYTIEQLNCIKSVDTKDNKDRSDNEVIVVNYL
jgi:DNA adenine methylase